MATPTIESGKVDFLVKVGGKELGSNSPIVAIDIDKSINKIPRANIRIRDGDFSKGEFTIGNSDLFSIDGPISIEAGYNNKLTLVFEGVITGLGINADANNSQGASFVVQCKNPTYKTTLIPKTATFLQSKDSDAISKVLKNCSGITVSVESTTVQHEYLLQNAITDWDFANIRAEANGQIIVVDDGKVTVKKPDFTGKSIFAITYGENMYHIEATIDARDQWKGAMGITWDIKTQKTNLIKGKEPGEKSLGSIGYGDLVKAHKQDPITISHGGSLAKKEMETLVTSLLEKRRGSKIKGKVTIQGNATIHPDQVITIEKGAIQFQGDGYVSGVQHIIEEGNWYTVLTLGLTSQRYSEQYSDISPLPAAGMLPPIHGLQIGTVQKIDADPQDEFRILVTLPMAHEKKEGVWCRIASLYASKGVGMFFMPEVGDEVIVGFINDDCRSPIIVGSLYSSKDKPPVPKIGKENSIKAIVSREKLGIIFNDIKGEPDLVLQTPNGNTVLISDKKGGIVLVDENKNAITLNEAGMTMNSQKDIILNAKGSISMISGSDLILEGTKNINLKGMNIQAKASMKGALEGSASVEVKSGGITTVKGGTVMIN